MSMIRLVQRGMKKTLGLRRKLRKKVKKGKQ